LHDYPLHIRSYYFYWVNYLQYWMRFEWHPGCNLYDYQSRYIYVLVPQLVCTTWAQHIYSWALNIFTCILLIVHFSCTWQKITRLLREFLSPIQERKCNCKLGRELYCTCILFHLVPIYCFAHKWSKYHIAQNCGGGKLWRIWWIECHLPIFYPTKFISIFCKILDFQIKSLHVRE